MQRMMGFNHSSYHSIKIDKHSPKTNKNKFNPTTQNAILGNVRFHRMLHPQHLRLETAQTAPCRGSKPV